MTMYIKHFYVGAEDPNIVLDNTNSIKGGKTHPNIPGLHVEFQTQNENGIDYCLSTAPEDATVEGIAGIEILAEQEWIEEWVLAFENAKQTIIRNIYNDYKAKFEELPDDYYHPYEMLYSSYIKRVESSLIKSDMTEEEIEQVAPTILKEAKERGIDVFVLAAKIIAHASTFDNAQAELLAERGKLVDQIAVIECDTTSLETIKESIRSLSREESIETLEE